MVADDLIFNRSLLQFVFVFLMYSVPKEVKPQYEDNIKWIKKAQENKLVVGSQARILYSDQKGRVAIALAFNEAIASKKIKVSNTKGKKHFDRAIQKNCLQE